MDKPEGNEPEPEKEISLGTYLKNQREMRQVSHSEIARVTKINVGILKNLETDNYSRLPSPPFVKGFLSSIGKYLGLDTHDLLLRYEQVLKNNPHYAAHRASPLLREPQPVPLEGARPNTSPTQSPRHSPPSDSFSMSDTGTFDKWFNKKTIPIYVTVILVAVILTLLKSVGRETLQTAQPEAESAPRQETTAPVTTPAPSAPAPTVAATPPPSTEPSPSQSVRAKEPEAPPTAEPAAPAKPEVTRVTPAVPGGPQEIKIRAKVDTFLKVQIANQDIQNISLRSGESATFSSSESIRLLLLNAGSISITHNGKAVTNVGKWGEPKIMEFPAVPKQ